MGKLKNTIYCIVGKSGCGKSTIVDKIAEEYGLTVLKSYTTRPKRHEDDNDHIYITKEEYDELPNKVATTFFDGNYYCATKEQVDDADLYVIDPAGVEVVKEVYDGEKDILTIYIEVPMNICLERMRKRGDSEDNCWSRLRHDDTAFRGFKGITDYAVNGISNLAWRDVYHLIHTNREEHIYE